MADLLVVIRSGATDYDLQGRISGNLDIPLTPAGIAAASETARHLAAAPPVALYTSPTTCAIETADVIGDRLHLVPRRVPHLVGLDLGFNVDLLELFQRGFKFGNLFFMFSDP